MLQFKRVAYRNLLSTGNTWTEVALDANPSTLIVGKNGAGKTVLLDAVCFGLYGRPFRGINKPLLLNTINGKGLLVEIEFTTQGKQYLVRRGVKPTVFDIVADGQVIPELPSVVEMQNYLEKNILHCNYKAFNQVVILGAASYVPFMRLTPAARREIIEEILDIEVFSTMHTLLKGKLTDVRAAITNAQHKHTVIASQHELAKTYGEQWVKQHETKRKLLEAELVIAEAAFAKAVAEYDQRKATYDALVPNPAVAKAIADQLENTRKIIKIEADIQHLKHNKGFFEKNDKCPTCTQEIEQGFKTNHLTEAASHIKALEDEKQALNAASQLMEGVIQAGEREREAKRALQNEISAKSSERHTHEAAVRQLRKSIDETKQPAPAPPKELGDLDVAKAEVDKLIREKHILEQGYTLLKDDGIRTKVVAQYLPVINTWINHYLTAMNFPIQFTLDEQFTETIKSRHRDVFTYENLSEGEKRRVDLSLVLTWRAIAKLKNSVHTNLLIFDEIFDSSLDVAGTDDFMRLLHTLSASTNVFVISHKTDILSDSFGHVLTVTKEKGFSVTKPMV